MKIIFVDLSSCCWCGIVVVNFQLFILMWTVCWWIIIFILFYFSLSTEKEEETEEKKETKCVYKTVCIPLLSDFIGVWTISDVYFCMKNCFSTTFYVRTHTHTHLHMHNMTRAWMDTHTHTHTDGPSDGSTWKRELEHVCVRVCCE